MRMIRSKGLAATAGICWGMVATFIAVAGCDRQPKPEADSDLQPTATATAPGESSDASSPRAVDAQDAPEAPRALPRSSEVQGWVKTGAVKVGSGDQISAYVQDAELASILGGYRFQQVANAEYTSPHAKAVVFMARGVTPEDALGAFSVVSDGADCATRNDGSLRLSQVDGDNATFTGWQGNDFIRVDCSTERPEGLKDCERLLGRTIFGLASAEPPLLMRAVKDLQQEHCRFWVVRSTAGLVKQPLPRLQQIEPAALDQRLGLNGEVLLSAVAVEQTQGAAPIIIWLAQYPAAEGAKAAAGRYAQALEANGKGLDSVTFVGSPKGPFLMGTWTADQETAKEMVKVLSEVLPGE